MVDGHSVRALILSATLALAAGRASAVPYFPSESGPTFQVTSGTVTIEASGPSFARVHSTGSGYYQFWSVESFVVDCDGDVLKSDEGGSCSACPDPDITYFDPPYLLLDFPLTTGKTWGTETLTRELWGPYEPVPVTVTGTVVGPATVTVPAGTFDVIEVRIFRQCLQRPELDQNFVYWLHPQLGPVNGLVSWEGIVPDEPVSWSGLKALFR